MSDIKFDYRCVPEVVIEHNPLSLFFDRRNPKDIILILNRLLVSFGDVSPNLKCDAMIFAGTLSSRSVETASTEFRDVCNRSIQAATDDHEFES